MYNLCLESPVGILQIFADDVALCQIAFPTCTDRMPPADPAPHNHPLLTAVSRQLNEYFAGSRKTFELPLSPRGTSFQQAVWELMTQIPYAETRTYAELAASLGNANKARAVGGAANKNPLPLVIPCHRVMGASGQLTGFAGGVAAKQFLLDLEKGCQQM